jgi:hypothetical protein
MSDRGDGGTIEALFNLDDDELADISKGHYNNVEAFRSTIANSGGGNFLLIPGSKGTVPFLHQGFVSTTTLGGATILGCRVALCLAASSETSKQTDDWVGTRGVEAAIIVISFINQAGGMKVSSGPTTGLGRKQLGSDGQ